ncbi:hypothetical protein [Polymorphospora sp. NPDC050346]|uniref:hypothetical protein n=1 Tax=Polymorphospora sp. NPDC050346 TaxID=3155780 RepID=UPI0033E94221
MDPWTWVQVERWLDWIGEQHAEFDYRYVFSAYLAASSRAPHSGETVMTTDASGGYVLRAGVGDRGLRLANDDERELFIAHLHERYCGDRYSSMRQWEEAQHAGFLEDTEWLYGRRRNEP